MQTIHLSGLESFDSQITTQRVTNLSSTETVFPTFSSIVDSMVEMRAQFEVKRDPTFMGGAEVVTIEGIPPGTLTAERVAEALISSPETDFISYETLPADSPLVLGIKTYYGVIPR